MSSSDIHPKDTYEGVPEDDNAEPSDAGLGEHDGPGTVTEDDL